MPLYYFDIHYPAGTHRDYIGDEFESLEDASLQARALLFAVARDDPSNTGGQAMACSLRDETDRVVYRGELSYRTTWILA